MARAKRGGGPKAGELMRAELGGSVSTGEKACSVGVRFAEDQLTLENARELLVNARLDVKLQPIMSDEEDAEKNGQALMWDDLAPTELRLEAEADCSGFSYSKRGLRTSLRFGAGNTEAVQALLKLRGKDVRLALARLGDSGTPEPEEAE